MTERQAKFYRVYFNAANGQAPVVYCADPPPLILRGTWEVFADARLVRPVWVNLDNVDRIEQV